MSSGDYGSRLDGLARRVGDLEDSDVKTQQRLDDLEADRESVRQLVTTIGLLGEKVNQALTSIDAIAERAVRKIKHDDRQETREKVRHRLNGTILGFGAIGAATAAWTHLFGLLQLFHIHF